MVEVICELFRAPIFALQVEFLQNFTPKKTHWWCVVCEGLQCYSKYVLLCRIDVAMIDLCHPAVNLCLTAKIKLFLINKAWLCQAAVGHILLSSK